MGGGKRTGQRTLPKVSGPLQMSFWSAQSWISVQEKQSTDTRGGGKRATRRVIQCLMLRTASKIEFLKMLKKAQELVTSKLRFRVHIFRAFALGHLRRPLFLWGERDLPHFLHFWGTANHAPSPQKTFLIKWDFWGGGVRIVGT